MPKDNPDVELAAAVMLNLFREGNRTIGTLKTAAAEHRAQSTEHRAQSTEHRALSEL